MPKFHKTAAGRIEPCNAVVRACPLGASNHYESQYEAVVATARELVMSGVTTHSEIASAVEAMSAKTEQERRFEREMRYAVDRALWDDGEMLPLRDPSTAAEHIFREVAVDDDFYDDKADKFGTVTVERCLDVTRSILIERAERFSVEKLTDPETGESYEWDSPYNKARRKYFEELIDEFDLRCMWIL